MTQIIKRLEAHVANQIAAGEVVQRPASIVKELLENAIDAGASSVSLHIKDGGKLLVQVIDNGKGMSAADALLCFERHTTSKLITAQDLFNIKTKGFRGEALASIATIAQLVLKTKRATDPLGTEVKIVGGQLLETKETVTAIGSSFSVNNLFFNIPARRNFLKSKQIEQRHITDEFHRVALIHPDISFSFYADESPIFLLEATSFKQRIIQIFGKKIQDKLVPVSEQTPHLKLSGYILKPEAAKKSKGTQFFFANSRFIKSSFLHFAVSNAFEGLISQRLHPGYFIQIEVPAATIDVNIHPTKTEVKFEDEHSLFAILRAAVKHALGQFNIAPILDFDRDPTLDHSYHDISKQVAAPIVSVNASFNPFENELKETKSNSFGAVYKNKKGNTQWESLYSGIQEASSALGVVSETPSNTLQYEEEIIQAALFNSNAAIDSVSSCFQLATKFIVTPTKAGLLLIHQSRAHQRILYEEFLNNFTSKEAGSQQLLFPKELQFTIPEIILLKELIPSLTALGFSLQIKDSETISIGGIPVLLLETNIEKVLVDFMDSFQNEYEGSHFSQTDFLAKALAKSMGIKTGEGLSYAGQQHIINSLFACKESKVSPFGKPIFNIISQTDLDLKFI